MQHLSDLLDESARRFSGLTALSIRVGGQWQEVTFDELSRRAKALATCLIRARVQEGDRIAILSENRPEWAVTFFAALRAGATVVPLDPRLGARELSKIVADCRPRILFTSPAQAETAQRLRTQVGAICSLQLLQDMQPKWILPSRRRRADETAVIVYTSSTTGRPKGVMISHANLVFEVTHLKQVVDIDPGDVFLSVLPLNHVLELTCGFLSVLNAGGTICFGNTIFPHELLEVMQERKIRAMLGVPLLFRGIRCAIQKQLVKGPAAKQWMFHLAWNLATLPWPWLRRRLFRSIHRAFGGCLRTLVSGGAPLEPSVQAFFERIGMPILQGYGLTEASPVVSVNTPRANRVGSVGRPLNGVEIKILDGEVLTRGPHVMKGYLRQERQTRKVIDSDGWLHTGDLGRIDADGYLFITGRRKTMIVLGGGKKVQPEEVETELIQSPCIEEVCVLGRIAQAGPDHGHEEVCAVVVPANAASPKEIESEVQRLGGNLAAFKRPTRIHFCPEGLPRTSTGKVSRREVHEWLNQTRTRELLHV